MITVGLFREMKCFDDNGSINEFIVDKIDYDKEKVIKYLSSQKRVASCPRKVKDCITDEVISSSFSVFEDGEFIWCDFLLYYIKNYNIKLPKELLDKI